MSNDIIKKFRSIEPDKYRNIAICAHVDSGKTTLTERILFFTGRIHKLQEVHDGGATMDFMAQEKERGITIQSAAITCAWNNHRINLIDTPGHVDFTIEVERSMRVLDAAVVVFDGVAGVEPQSKIVNAQANKYQLPRIYFVNKMDRLGANFNKAYQSIVDKLTDKVVILSLPVGSEKEFSGIIDILSEKYIHWTGADNGLEFEYRDIPTDMVEEVKTVRRKTVDTIVETDDELLMKMMNGEELKLDEIKNALRRSIIKNELIPVVCGSALKNIGVQYLLDLVIEYFPSPLEVKPIDAILTDKKGNNPTPVTLPFDVNGPLVGFIFKTQTRKNLGNVAFIRIYSGVLKKGVSVYNSVSNSEEKVSRIVIVDANTFHDVEEGYCGEVLAILFREKVTKTGDTICNPNHVIQLKGITIPEPVISMSIEAVDQKDTLALTEAIKSQMFDDPSLRFFVKDNQLLIMGVGELHLQILRDRIETENFIKSRLGQPKVEYKITLKKGLKERYIHKKQSGGAGEFADIVLELEPLERGTGIEFQSKVVSGRVPTEYIPAVEDGVKKAASEGINGCKIVDVKAILWDGSYHSVDSNSTIFKNTAQHFFINLMKQGGLNYLEPIMKVTVNVEGEANRYYGDVSGDIAKRRGVQCEESNTMMIVAEVPLSEMFGYINTLRSMTKGLATFNMEFLKYNIMPETLVEQLIFKNNKDN